MNAKSQWDDVLRNAVITGNIELAVCAMDHGASPNTFVLGKENLVIMAIDLDDNGQMLKLLLDRGANPNVISGFIEMSPLHKTITQNKPDYFKILLQFNADVNLCDVNEKNVPLFTVYKILSNSFSSHLNDYAYIFDILLKRSLNVNMLVNDDEIVYGDNNKILRMGLIHKMAMNGDTANMKKLFSCGGDIKLKNSENKSAFDIAVRVGCFHVGNFLLSNGYIPNKKDMRSLDRMINKLTDVKLLNNAKKLKELVFVVQAHREKLVENTKPTEKDTCCSDELMEY